MLWPVDHLVREKAVAASFAALLVQSLPGMVEAGERPDMRDVAAAVTFAANAPPLAELHESAKAAFCHGTFVGHVFLEALADAETGPRAGLQTIKDRVASRFRGKRHFEALSASTIENRIWKPYRQVAHFWTAHLLLAAWSDHGGDYPFPCALSDLDRFLGVADVLREAGQRRRRQAQPLLDAANIWLLPFDLEFTRLRLEWTEAGTPAFSIAD